MSDTPSLRLPLMAAEQAQKHVTHNEALRALDAIVQLAVKDRSRAVPPDSPTEEDRYIVADGAAGPWAGHVEHVAAWQDGAWAFFRPRKGWRCWVDEEDQLLVFDGQAWGALSGGAGGSEVQNLALLGIGTAADATNPFSAKLNKALWTAKTASEGGDGDLRYTLNKESAGDVLSLLLQSGFSGRAELGLLGDDNLRLKVSGDGVSWVDAIVIDRADGKIGLGAEATEALHLRRTGPAPARLLIEGENAVNNQVRRVSNNAASPNFLFQKARGSLAAEAAVAQSDLVGGLTWQGHDGAAYRTLAQLLVMPIAALPGPADMEGCVVLSVTPPSSGTATEILRLEHATGLSLFGANPVVDGNRHLRLRSYTLANLPAANIAAGQMIFCSDLGGGGGQLNSDGTSWRRVSRGGSQSVAADAGFTLTTLLSAEEQRHTGSLTANRTVTLSTANSYSGARFRVTRTGGGAFNLNVGGLKNLGTNTWCEVIFDGAAWYLAAYGTL